MVGGLEVIRVSTPHLLKEQFTAVGEVLRWTETGGPHKTAFTVTEVDHILGN